MAITFHRDGCLFWMCGGMGVGRWVEGVVREERLGAGDVAFVFCGRKKHLAMNREFLGHDWPTDVITFDYSEAEVVSGDIFVDIRTVRENAKRFGGGFREELRRVMVHGVLHLCGYGDATPEEQQTMRAKEDYYLRCRRAHR